MPITSNFKTCTHSPEGKPPIDWRECYKCLDEVAMQMVIARTYLKEIAEAQFNDNGDCVQPISEPVQGRSYQQIAATGLSMISD